MAEPQIAGSTTRHWRTLLRGCQRHTSYCARKKCLLSNRDMTASVQTQQELAQRKNSIDHRKMVVAHLTTELVRESMQTPTSPIMGLRTNVVENSGFLPKKLVCSNTSAPRNRSTTSTPKQKRNTNPPGTNGVSINLGNDEHQCTRTKRKGPTTTTEKKCATPKRAATTYSSVGLL